MTTSTQTHAPSLSLTAGSQAWSWPRLTRSAAITVIVTTVLMMSIGRFIGPSFVVLDAVLLVGLWRMRRGGRRGMVPLALISLANVALHAPINAALLSVIESPLSFLITVVHVIATVLTLAGAVAVWRGRDSASTTPRRLVLVGAAITAAAMVAGVAAYTTRANEPAAPGDVLIVNSGSQVSPQELTAAAGTVTVHITNTDPVAPRSFDINELGVHTVIPPRTARRVTFSASAGTYDFYDQVTFTPATNGVLTVR